MAAIQETGVQATIGDYDGFMSGLKMMNLGIQQLGKAIASTAKQSQRAAPQIAKTAQANQGLGKMVEGAIGSLTSATGAVGTLVSALGGPVGLVAGIGVAIVSFKSIKAVIEGVINTIVQFVQQGISSFIGFAQQGLLLASRFREMENAAIAVGRSFGIADEVTRDSISALEDAGIRYDVAANSVLRMTRNQIDLANATDLARIAQATGIIVGEDSSATMDRLIHAISTGNTAMLGFMNITVTNNDVQREAQELFGKNVDALTAQEKTQARVNAIIKGSASVMGVYNAAMDSAGKSLRSLTGRLIPTLGAEMMKTFEPAFKTAVSAVSDLVEFLINATKEGGELYPILIRLGAYASLAADGFKFLTDVVQDYFPEIIATVKWVLQAVDVALGVLLNPVNYIVQTIRLITGISDEMRVGFTQITEDTFRYGAKIIAAFAEGMVSAAHQAMTVIANVVNDLMSFWFAPGSPPRVVPNIDKWGAATMTEYLKGFAEADFGVLGTVQQALGAFMDPKQLGKLSKELIKDIAAEGGVGEAFFGRIAGVAGTAGKEIARLARLEFNLAEATRKMQEANERYNQSQLNVTKEIKEYNELLRQGASEQELAAKLAEVQAAEQERTAAATEAQVAAQDLTEQEKALNLQRQLVDQLTALQGMLGRDGSLVASATGAAKGIASGLKETLGDMGDFGEAIGGDISNKIGVAIDKMKTQLKTKLRNIFQPLIDAWYNIKMLIFGRPVGVDDEQRFEGGIVQLFNETFEDVKLIIAGFEVRLEIFRAVLWVIFDRIRNTIETWYNDVRDWFTVKLPEHIDTLKTKFDETLLPAWEALRDIIGADEDSVTAALEWLDDFTMNTFLEKTISEFVRWMYKEKGLIAGLERVEVLMWLIGEAVGTLVTFIRDAAEEFANFINQVDDTRNAASPFTDQSPSPLEQGITGATRAMRSMIPTVNRMTGAYTRVGVPAPLPVSTTTSTMSTSTRTTNLNIGSVIIQGGMSWADFRTRVTRAIVTSGA